VCGICSPRYTHSKSSMPAPQLLLLTPSAIRPSPERDSSLRSE
jgi:hypothetical protein